MVLIKEGQESEYIAHVTPEKGDAVNIAKQMIRKFEELQIDTQNLSLIGADGCLVNTGWKAGAIRQIEELLNKPLQRSVCMLHLGELPLRAVFEAIYGKSVGPYKFQGELGESLEICHTIPVARFKRVTVAKLPKFDVENMSQDQRYLFELASAVSSGKVSERLANKTPGKLGHSRWLTFAARILRFYVTQEKPDPNLTILVLFVMKIYLPHWQNVRTMESISYGSYHFLELIKKTR